MSRLASGIPSAAAARANADWTSPGATGRSYAVALGVPWQAAASAESGSARIWAPPQWGKYLSRTLGGHIRRSLDEANTNPERGVEQWTLSTSALSNRIEQLLRAHQREPLLTTTGTRAAIDELTRRYVGLEQAVREIALEVEKVATSQS